MVLLLRLEAFLLEIIQFYLIRIVEKYRPFPIGSSTYILPKLVQLWLVPLTWLWWSLDSLGFDKSVHMFHCKCGIFFQTLLALAQLCL